MKIKVSMNNDAVLRGDVKIGLSLGVKMSLKEFFDSNNNFFIMKNVNIVFVDNSELFKNEVVVQKINVNFAFEST